MFLTSCLRLSGTLCCDDLRSFDNSEICILQQHFGAFQSLLHWDLLAAFTPNPSHGDMDGTFLKARQCPISSPHSTQFGVHTDGAVLSEQVAACTHNLSLSTVSCAGQGRTHMPQSTCPPVSSSRLPSFQTPSPVHLARWRCVCSTQTPGWQASVALHLFLAPSLGRPILPTWSRQQRALWLQQGSATAPNSGVLGRWVGGRPGPHTRSCLSWQENRAVCSWAGEGGYLLPQPGRCLEP